MINVKHIWDLFPQNERQVAKFHFQVKIKFMLFRLLALKWYIICHGCCLIWGPKRIISLEKFLCFLLILKCKMSHISFSSLATCRSFRENRSHFSISLLYDFEYTCSKCKIVQIALFNRVKFIQTLLKRVKNHSNIANSDTLFKQSWKSKISLFLSEIHSLRRSSGPVKFLR